MNKNLIRFVLFCVVQSKSFSLPAEVKINISSASFEKALSAFNLTPENAQNKLVYFLDTPERDLAKKGVYLRIRTDLYSHKGSAVLKYRSQQGGSQCEYDASSAKKFLACSVKNEFKGDFSKHTESPQNAFENLFDQNQIEYVEKRVSFNKKNLEWVGPIQSFRWTQSGFDFETWVLPGYKSKLFLEISKRVDDDKLIEQTRSEIRNYLAKHDVKESSNSETKTDRVLLGK